MKRFLLLIVLFVQGVYAQVQFTAEPDKTTLGLDERLRIDFTMNGDGDDFVAPSFTGFDASGPMINIRNYWVNNKHSYSKIYTFFLQPRKKGTFTIGSAFVEIDNKRYKTAPFKVTVTDAAPSAPVVEPETGAGLYLVAVVNKTNPYVNEAVSVVYRLYVGYQADVRNYSIAETPKYNDFWSQRLESDYTRVHTGGLYKGQEYNYVELMPTVLYPQKSGALEIDPLSLEIILDVPTGQVDFFGDPIVRQEKKILRAEKKIINVKALPQAGRPESFTGAVGSFDFKVVPSKTTVSGGQAIDLTLSSEGRGNLKLFQLPKAIVPEGLEAYDPAHTEEVDVPLSGMQGRITDKYSIIAQKKGRYTIAPISFSYFDPATGSYKTIKSEEFTVNVLSDASAEDMAAASVENNKPQFRANATDTRFSRMDSEDFFGSVLFYVLVVLPFALIPVIIIARRKREEIEKDIEGNRKKHTNKLAKKYLGEAKANIGNKELFYIALERALHNFLRAKLSIETADMSKQNIRDLLASKNVDAGTIENFITIMNNCEFARYAPSTDAAMQQDYDLAETVMNSLEKQL